MVDVTILTDVQPEFDYVVDKEKDKLSKRERLRRRLREKFIQRKKEKGESCNLFSESGITVDDHGNIYINLNKT